MPDHALVGDHELTDAPALDLVGDLRHRHAGNPRIAAVSAHGIFRVPEARNEPVLGYEPGSPERDELQRRLDELASERLSIPLVIGGEEVETGDTFEAVMPHKRSHVLADVHKGGAAEVDRAIAAAAEAWEDWSRTPWEERAAVFLRAAELLAGPWRQTLNAATMLGQSKTAHQAEIDAACELIDFWRFNVAVHDAHLRGAADLARPASGTGSSTGRSRASSSPSRRSTSRRSPATSRPRRRSWATRSCGSRPRRPRC